MRKLAVLVATIATLIVAPAALILAPTAGAIPPSIPSVMGGDLQCAQVTSAGTIVDPTSNNPSPPVVSGTVGQRWCGSVPGGTTTFDSALPATRSTVKTFDDTPLDVNVAFPSGSDGPFPVVGMYHGYGGTKMNFSVMQRWLQKGYAVFSLTNRGSGESCKNQGSIAADPTGCAEGWVHLMDPRFEIRDAQLFLGMLVDDGVIVPDRIAATGGSYGGSESMHFAVLKNRMMMMDGSLVPWQSPLGTSMSTAVATPNIPWTDLIQSLAPNGDTLDYLEDGSFTGVGGVMKESYVNGLYISARSAPPGVDPGADLAGWKGLLDAGEPYTGAANQAMFDEITNYHSSYYVDDSQSPAPLLMSSGFTDDLFPVDEVIRYYNRTRADHPNTPMSIFAGSFGHARGQNQSNVTTALRDLEERWVDYYLGAVGSQPASEVTTYTQTCPSGTDGGGPYTADAWASLAPGEIVLKSGSKKTIAFDGADPAVSALYNPILSPDACTTAPDAVEPGSASYDTAPAPAGGYTVMGSATVMADFTVANGPDSQIAARLVDLDNAGNKMLVARGSWRPKASGFQVFQLHPGAWEVEEGHSLRLELLQRDAFEDAPSILTNYARPSNDQQNVTVEKLELRIPVLESPGDLDGLVKAPKKKVLPARGGAALAPGYKAIGSKTISKYAAQYAVNPKLKGKAKAKGKTAKVKITCAASADSCKKAKVVLKAKGKTVAKGKNIKTTPGKSKTVKLKMTSKGRKLFKKKGSKKQKKSLKAKVLINGKKSGSITIKRTGKIK
jgi:hypothetical protein